MDSPELKKILIVEDEPDIRKVATLALSKVGEFTVEAASNGKDGIAKALDFQPQLILLDVMMPEMDGPATLLELRKLPETQSIPVIFLTAKIQKQEVENYKQLGACEVIGKPFDPMSLSRDIKEIWSRL